jgi:hypothetical protein
MPDWGAYKEAERRGILTEDKQTAYNEAKRRGLVPGFGETPETAPAITQAPRTAEITVGEPPSFLENAFSGVFGEDIAKIRAKSANAMQYAEAFNIRPSQAYELHDQISKELGGKQMPTTMELLMVPMTAAIVAGLASHPLTTVAALGMFEALSEAESAAISFVQGEEYKAFQRKGLVDILPEDLNSTTELAVEAVDLLWKGVVTAGGLVGGKVGIANIKTIINGHKMPKLYIDKADLAQVDSTRKTRAYIDKMETTEDGVIIADPSRGPIPKELQPIAKLDPRQESRIELESLAATERLGKVEQVTPQPVDKLKELAGDTDPVKFLKSKNYGNGIKEVAEAFGVEVKTGEFVGDLRKRIAVEAGVNLEAFKPIEFKGKPIEDTREGGKLFHGSSSEISSVRGDQYTPENIYGQGFYTTDAVDVAGGYTRKGRGKASTIYEITSPEVKVKSMEEPLEADFIAWAKDTDIDIINQGLAEKPKNLRELYDNIRDFSAGERISQDTVQESFDSIQVFFSEKGFGGYEHIGGLKTNQKPHKVKIFFPETKVDINKVDPEGFRPKPPTQAIKPLDAAERVTAEARVVELQDEFVSLERQAAEADIVDINLNARQAAQKVDAAGFKTKKVVSLNRQAHGWYLEAGYQKSSVISALEALVSGKKLGKLQEDIIRDWRTSQEELLARFEPVAEVEPVSAPEPVSKVTAETELADNIKSLEATEPSSFLVDAPLTTIGEAPPPPPTPPKRPSLAASSPEPSGKRPVFEIVSKVAKVAGKDAKVLRKQLGEMADEYLGAISTRLGNIDPALKSRLRKFEFEVATKRVKRLEESLPLFEKVKAMSKSARKEFDLARKNADSAKIAEIVKREGLEKENKAVRDLLDNLHKEATDAGLDVGFIKDFHPRVLKDKEGFLEHFRGQEDWPLIDKAIRDQETKLGRYLEQDEKADLINSLLRGYRRGAITLSKPSELKAREIEKIDAELDQFYMDSDAALINYISSVTEAIEARRLFGKKAKGVDNGDMSDTIGGFVSDLLHEGKIKPKDEHVIKDILSARFNQIGTRGIVGVYKNLSYIDTMGNSISAITQVGDTAWALYKAGVPRTLSAVKDAVQKKSLVTREDIGIDQISAEFADASKSANAVGRIFDMVGLSRMDAIGKESLINAEYKTLIGRAKTPAGRKLLEQELKPVFEGETKALIEDLKAERITENVKLHLFNTLADFQPIALSEMPQKYLTGGNGRLFYMLKSFTLKQFDVYRREVFQQIAKPETRVKGIKNMVKLSAAFVTANASADAVKALVLGRPIELEDLAVDNMLRLFGISKFVTWKAREEGVGSAAVRQISPPFKFIDSLSKDINSAGDEKGLETIGSIPVAGKLYYWWFGKGREKIERKKSSKISN